MLNRALLYLKRRKHRSLLLFLLLSSIALCLSVGLSVWGSISAVTSEVQNRLGTSFVLKKVPLDMENEAYYTPVVRWDGSQTKGYVGENLDPDLADRIRQINGVREYDGELAVWICVEDINLLPGASHHYYQYYAADPEKVAEIKSQGVLGGWDSYEIGRYNTVVYGHTNTGLYDKFRSGAFSLTEGRHITPDDRQKVLISEELAEYNGLHVGDPIRVTLRGDNIGIWEDVKKVYGEIEMEIVGLFHVNGYQPMGELVHEDRITYNWLISDEDTVHQLDKLWSSAYYQDFERAFGYDNLTFFVDDPTQLTKIVNEVEQLDDPAVSFFDISLDDTMYKSTVEPLKSIRNVVTGLTLAIIAGCVIVLLIVFTM